MQELVNFKLYQDLWSVDFSLYEANNGNIKTICGICSKLTINTPERRRSSVFSWT